MENQKHSLLFENECFVIRGAIFDVYKELGNGFLESVYQECLEIELHKRMVPFQSQKELPLEYKGISLNHTYRPDLICFDSIIIELKVVKESTDEHRAQLMNYLKISKMKLGLLVNFGHYPKATIERIVF